MSGKHRSQKRLRKEIEMDPSAFNRLPQLVSTLLTIATVVCMSLLVAFSYLLWVWLVEPDWRHDALTRGHAEICESDGRFAWVGECEDD
jgi:hypothetical protein